MRVSAEIVIERPMEAVWEWASDPRHWERWEEENRSWAERVGGYYLYR
jgi:uncharacterized protein YndB with AHSA1/START domain